MTPSGSAEPAGEVLDHSSTKPLGCPILKKALGRNKKARMPESTQPVTRCHFGIVSLMIFYSPVCCVSGISVKILRWRGRVVKERSRECFSSSFAPASGLDCGDVDLFHRHHGFHAPLRG